MQTNPIHSGPISIGGNEKPLIIAGQDSLESEELVLTIATELKRLAARHAITMVFKGSYDKANRSSHTSYRGPGLRRGIELLEQVKEETGLPVTSDVHTVEEVEQVALIELNDGRLVWVDKRKVLHDPH